MCHTPLHKHAEIASVQLTLLRTQSPVPRIALTFVLVFLIVLDVNAALTVVEAAAEPVLQVEHVMELVIVCATETVSERNVEMMVVVPEISATSVVLLKSVELTSDVLELVLPTAEMLTVPKEFVVTTDVSDHAVNALPLLDKIFVAEMDNVFADLLATKTSVDLMVVEEPVEPVPEMPPVLMDNVLTQFPDVVEMVSANRMKILANATLIVEDVVSTVSVKRHSARLSLTVSKIV